MLKFLWSRERYSITTGRYNPNESFPSKSSRKFLLISSSVHKKGSQMGESCQLRGNVFAQFLNEAVSSRTEQQSCPVSEWDKLLDYDGTYTFGSVVTVATISLILTWSG